ncbi:MAG: hypothetical protein KF729_02850 [Sandaracinaceae bacterium]|nr:hypothetical protein [Sandaracinaceae bacterium]
MSDVERRVIEAAARGAEHTWRVAELHPRRALELLAETEKAFRLEIERGGETIAVELGNGLVVGAEASVGGARLAGAPAFARARDVEDGQVRLLPLRFPSLANILAPVAPGLELDEEPPRPQGEDTIEVALPRARPFHPPPPAREPATLELELPEDAIELAVAAPPPPPHALAVVLPATRAHVAPPPRHRRAAPALAALAALGLLGAAGTGLALIPGGDTPAPEAVAPIRVDVAPAQADSSSVDMDFAAEELDEDDEDTEAQALAREARQRMARGDREGGLEVARRAADLRGGVPSYQVLLGDALRANGQRSAARRAYRRALRLRPGYAPAVRRLERSAPGPASQT